MMRPCPTELGGGFLSTDENEGSSPPPLAGSVLIVYYPSIEDVKKRIERDPYWINNVVSFTFLFQGKGGRGKMKKEGGPS